MIIEEWKIIKDYNTYMVSNIGRVKNTSFKGIGERMLKPSINGSGYLRVGLTKNGLHKTVNIHRLVAISFLNNKENKRCVNHIDGNKLNNNVYNLEWCTHSENNLHAYNIGLMKTTENNPFKKNHPRSNKGKFGIYSFVSKKIAQYSKDLILIKNWDSAKDIERALGTSSSSISQCCSGRNKTAGGFKFIFIN